MLLVLPIGACFHVAGETSPAAPAEPPGQLAADIAESENLFLAHNVGFGPAVAYTAQTRSQGGVVVTATPARLEAEAWNSWPDGTARLVNDAVAFGMEIAIHPDPDHASVQWDPRHTELAVNTTDQVFPPAIEPDEILTRLLLLARYEARGGLPPDAQLRLRNADAFRTAYLTTAPAPSAVGTVIFPAPAANLFAVALQLKLGVEVDGSRVETFVFLFE